ncbi:MAG TPA: hypothetical protein VJ927_09065 [Actinomycetota bacterium]|nr:hypothetical protein [Actinomycetota bacterium]
MVRRALAVVLFVGLFWTSASASARPAAGGYQGPVIVSGAVGQFYGYLTPAMVVQRSGELTYANFDIVQHDVVQDVKVDGVFNKKRKGKWCKGFGKTECPLFWSARAGLAETVPVQGLQNLEAGQIYSFYCTLHPGMKGKLAVTD